MEPKWLDKLSVLPGFHMIRMWGMFAIIISTLQMGLSASVYNQIDTFQLGAWWIGLVVIISSIGAIVAVNRVAIYVVCIFSIMSTLVGIVGSCIDMIAANSVGELKGCSGSDGKYFYGHSYVIHPSESCYEAYSFEKHDCYCVASSNSTLTPFGNVASTTNGITCILLDGKILQNSENTDACSVIFTSWGPTLYAAAYFDVFATIAIFVVAFLTSAALCCPSCLRRCNIYDDSRFNSGFEKMPTA